MAVIYHIPHSSTKIPQDFKHQFIINSSQLNDELIKLTDWYTDELFPNGIIFPISRLVCDVERFIDDNEEEMAKIGMGIIYTRGSDLSIIKKVTLSEKAEVLRRYYIPHHNRLTRMVDNSLEKDNKCLIVDCHSFSSEPLPYETDENRPDICIGTDSYHTDDNLLELVKQSFIDLGYTVLVNSPFTGSIVPNKFYQKDKRVQSIMIEVNKSLYTDGKLKSRNFYTLKNDIHLVCSRIEHYFNSI